MDCAPSSFATEYAPPKTGRREHVCPACWANLFDRPHELSCPFRKPPLIVYLSLDQEGHRLEVELEHRTERALRRWLASGRSTAHEGPRQ